MITPIKTFEYKGHIIELYPDDYLYHGTTEDNIEGISKQGLRPDHSDYNLKAVWLDTDYSSAEAWGNWFERGSKPLVLAVRVSDLDPDKIELDPYNEDYFDSVIDAGIDLGDNMATFIYKGIIPPKNLIRV